MLTAETFGSLLRRSESSVLDFKKAMYSFAEDHERRKTAEFVKDIISFSNTIRKETSYIIIGVEDKKDGAREFPGLDETIDDSILQDKVKDKVFPRPTFSYYTIVVEGKKYGVIEFPVVKYEAPIVPTKSLKGLEVGKVYYRKGTSNTEALAMEIISINNWLASLPNHGNTISFSDDIRAFLRRLTTGSEPLSSILADMLIFSKQHGYSDLMGFCSDQLSGVKASNVVDQDDYKYRIQNVFISLHHITIQRGPFITPESVKREMQGSKDFFVDKILFNNPILEIEDYKNRPNGLVTVKMSVKDVLPEIKEEYPVYAYIFPDAFAALYNDIRQEAIDKLMVVLVSP
jgi:hypothetical protein